MRTSHCHTLCSRGTFAITAGIEEASIVGIVVPYTSRARAGASKLIQRAREGVTGSRGEGVYREINKPRREQKFRAEILVYSNPVARRLAMVDFGRSPTYFSTSEECKPSTLNTATCLYTPSPSWDKTWVAMVITVANVMQREACMISMLLQRAHITLREDASLIDLTTLQPASGRLKDFIG